MHSQEDAPRQTLTRPTESFPQRSASDAQLGQLDNSGSLTPIRLLTPRSDSRIERQDSGQFFVRESPSSSPRVEGKRRTTRFNSRKGTVYEEKSPTDSLKVPQPSLDSKPAFERMPYRKKTEPGIKTQQHISNLVSGTSTAGSSPRFGPSDSPFSRLAHSKSVTFHPNTFRAQVQAAEESRPQDLKPEPRTQATTETEPHDPKTSEKLPITDPQTTQVTAVEPQKQAIAQTENKANESSSFGTWVFAGLVVGVTVVALGAYMKRKHI